MNEKQFFEFWQEVLSDSNYLLKVPEVERDEDMYLITIERCSSPTFQMSKLKHETLTAIPKEFTFKQMTYSGTENLVNENIREHIPLKYIALANTLKLEEIVPDNLVKNFRDEPVYDIYYDGNEDKGFLEASGYGKTARTDEISLGDRLKVATQSMRCDAAQRKRKRAMATKINDTQEGEE